MAERNERVMERIRQELKQRPDSSSRDLYAMAQQLEPSLANTTSLRQFHAGYVLPLKRSRGANGDTGTRPRSGGKPASRRSSAPQQKQQGAERPQARAQEQSERPSADRDQIRAVFLEFARDFSEAESRSEIVSVLSSLDQYVDRVAGTSR